MARQGKVVRQEREAQAQAVEEIVATIPETDGETGEELPPIHLVVVPESLKTKSGLIRWYSAVGYSRAAIAKHMNLIYQHVRNVLMQEPKRGVREAMPSLEVVLVSTDITEQDLSDIGFDAVLDSDLEAAAIASSSDAD
ncbi:MAG: hypothetical protein ACRDBG_23550 [Waterburya sp.]